MGADIVDFNKAKQEKDDEVIALSCYECGYPMFLITHENTINCAQCGALQGEAKLIPELQEAPEILPD